MKTDTVFKLAFNRMLELIAGWDAGAPLPSENELRRLLDVSRTTVRKVLRELAARGLILDQQGQRSIAVGADPAQGFPAIETIPASEQVEKRLMEWMLRDDTKPGSMINELDLARKFGVGTSGIREFLNRFSRFGLIEKRPNSGWLFRGFTEDFALELFEIRELFELRSALAFARQPADAPPWARLRQIEAEHRSLLSRIATNFHDFSDLDNRFHRLINEGAPNRFIDDFYDIITFIFHYHYQWNKKDERQRNGVAIEEHLAYIDALFSRDPKRVSAACRTHLGSARRTLLRAL
jgi:DNA-binding GntR family transcriptional regulator